MLQIYRHNWLIFWITAPIIPVITEAPQNTPGATLEGTITYSGPLLKPVPIAETGSAFHPIVRDEATLGLQEAVVWLEYAQRPPREPSPAKPNGAPLLMDQFEYEFIPHVLAIQAGQTVKFINSDAANHGVTASSTDDRDRFNVVTPARGHYEHTFVSTRQPVAIGCPIHASMSAWIYVFDHPYFAVTDSLGNFKITNIPPGSYTIRVRHAEGGFQYDTKQNLDVSSPTILRVEFTAKDLISRKP